MAKRILVIEDQPAIRQMLTDLFSSKGYEVVAKHDGEEGLHAVQTSEFDVIITDLKMPEMDGLQFLDQLSGLHKGPAIVYSSVTYPYAEKEVYRKGAVAFINKDEASPIELLDAVEQLIHKSNS